MRFAAVVALAAVAVKAQSGPGNYSSSLNMTIDPNSVEDSTRGESHSLLQLLCSITDILSFLVYRPVRQLQQDRKSVV